ncbi:MAG: redoxin domain-containing protein [Anaerolineae bacterium]|nr:redoxin domain-containing protein [Anaerolineae bacterium]
MTKRYRQVARVALWLLTVVLAATACAPAQSAPDPAAAAPTSGPGLGPEPPSSAPVVAPSSSALRPQPPRVGAQAADFSLEDLTGQPVSLSDLHGKKVMLNFWATWCGPCQFEIPHMVQLYGELRGQDFEILAVNLREDPERVKRFVEEYEMAFRVLLDRNGKVASSYFVRGIPTSIFLDEQGIIQAVHTGTLTDALLRQYVDDLIK